LATGPAADESALHGPSMTGIRAILLGGCRFWNPALGSAAGRLCPVKRLSSVALQAHTFRLIPTTLKVCLLVPFWGLERAQIIERFL